jgi:type VI secretion system secreted protein VgrG
MSMIFRHTQANSFAAISTELGTDFFLLEGLRGVERMSRLFHFDLELLSERAPVDFKKIVGKPVSIRIDLPLEPKPRYLHGHISRISQLRDRDGFLRYRAELVPWLWFLTRTTDCRIYQNQSVTEIIEQVCKDHDHTDIQLDVDEAVKSEKIEYCVQYRESDFNFISRLMEHAGISYYFVHEEDRHTLVLVNQPGKYPASHGVVGAVPYKEDARDPGAITDLMVMQDVRSARTVYRDYNFETPQVVLEVGAAGTVEAEHGQYEVYDYHPGRYRERDPGESLARQRMEALEGTHRTVRGSSTFRGMAPGHKFEIGGHAREDVNAKYVALEVWHELVTGGFVGEEPQYRNEFVAVPVDTPLRPDHVTPRPVVEGPQTAVVVGEAGEEIYTDEHGRVKVQFHWDRLGEKNENSTCWVRVSQGWAGLKYGFFFLPRVGHEVIVDFLEGDPDQPILTGAVYNAQQKPPYDLPAERSKSTIKTDSYKGGGGYNELRFEDKKDSEEIFLHAQKDLNEVVEHDHTTTVKNNQVITVTGHQTISIKGEGQSGTKVDGKEVKGSSHDVTGSHFINASDTITIKAPTQIKLECGGSTITMVPGTITLEAGGHAKIVLDANALMKANGGGTVFLDANAKMNANAQGTVFLDANAKMNGSGGGTVFLDANAKMNGSGGGTVFLDANADMSGGTASVVAKGDAALSGASTTVSGGKVAVAGEGSVDITGGVVKIN